MNSTCDHKSMRVEEQRACTEPASSAANAAYFHRCIGNRRGCGGNRVRAFSLFALISILLPGSAFAQSWGQAPPPRRAPVPAGERPRDLDEVRIDQRLNESLPLDAVFRDENGNDVKLGAYFGQKPVVLAFVYYTCPMLCNQVLN